MYTKERVSYRSGCFAEKVMREPVTRRQLPEYSCCKTMYVLTKWKDVAKIVGKIFRVIANSTAGFVKNKLLDLG